MPRQPSKKPLKKQCDSLVRQILQIRDGGRCQKCNKAVKGRQGETSHVIPKRLNAHRWDLLNTKLLCYNHHRFWWHRDTMAASKWFNEKYPARVAYLETIRNNIVKDNEMDFLGLRDSLRAKLEELKGERGESNGQ